MPMLRLGSLSIVAALAFVVLPFDEEDEHIDVRDVAAQAKIGLVQAIDLALKAQPGSAVEAELEGEVEDGKTEIFYEVMVVGTDRGLFEVKLDCVTGAVFEAARATDPDELEELAVFEVLLSNSKRTLKQLVEAADAIVKGQAVSAQLEDDHGAPSCEVTFVHARYRIEVEVEARGGLIRELELSNGDDDEDADDED